MIFDQIENCRFWQPELDGGRSHKWDPRGRKSHPGASIFVIFSCSTVLALNKMIFGHPTVRLPSYMVTFMPNDQNF